MQQASYPPTRYVISEADKNKIDNAFIYHAPKTDQGERYVELRDKAKELALLMTSLCPASRELSVALTELETACMWANASIARNE